MPVTAIPVATNRFASDPNRAVWFDALVEGIDLADSYSGTVVGATKSGAPMVGEVAVFIHGFDTDWTTALLRGAWLQEWLRAGGWTGSVAMFSWPSAGVAVDPFPAELWKAYADDQARARASGPALADALSTVLCEAGRAHLLIHSMGAVVLSAALAGWRDLGDEFGAAILAAPDEDQNAFTRAVANLSLLGRIAKRTTVLYSHDDLVLDLAMQINRIGRLGQAGPIPAYPAADLLDCTEFDDYDGSEGLVNSHQYYRMSPTARAKIVDLLKGR